MGWGWGFSAEASVFGAQGEAFRFQELRGADGPEGSLALRALRFVLLGVFRVLSLGSSLGRRRHPHLENIPAQVLFLRFSGLVLLCGAKHGTTTTIFRLEFQG